MASHLIMYDNTELSNDKNDAVANLSIFSLYFFRLLFAVVVRCLVHIYTIAGAAFFGKRAINRAIPDESGAYTFVYGKN